MTTERDSYANERPVATTLPKVLFCPFCGGGTLLLVFNKYLWECLKCRITFGVQRTNWSPDGLVYGLEPEGDMEC